MAAPNSIPAIDNVGRARLQLVLAAEGTALTMVPGSHDLSGLVLSTVEKAFVTTLIDAFLAADRIRWWISASACRRRWAFPLLPCPVSTWASALSPSAFIRGADDAPPLSEH